MTGRASACQRHANIAISQVIEMPKKHLGYGLRCAAGPSRLQLVDPAAKDAIELSRQAGDEFVEERSHLLLMAGAVSPASLDDKHSASPTLMHVDSVNILRHQ